MFAGKGEIRLNMSETWGCHDWFAGTVPESDVDDTLILQKAVDSVNRLLIPNGDYRISQLVIRRPVTLRGTGSHRVPIKADASCRRMITVQSGEVSFENFRFDMHDTGEGSVCFYMDTDLCDMSGISLVDCYIDGAYTAVTDADGEHSVSEVIMTGVTCQTARGTQLVLRDFVRDITLIDFAILRRHAADISCNMAGAIIENASEMRIEHFDVNGDWSDEGNEGHGMIFRNCRNVKMRKVLMEYLSGTGFIIENCSGFDWENVQTYTFSNNGFYVDGLRDSEFRVVKVTYNNGQGKEWPDKENYVFLNCSGLTLNSVISNGARGVGLLISHCTDLVVNGYLFCDRIPTGKNYAFLDGGGNERVLINGFTDASTLSNRSYSLSGSGVELRSVWLTGSVFREKITEGIG